MATCLSDAIAGAPRACARLELAVDMGGAPYKLDLTLQLSWVSALLLASVCLHVAAMARRLTQGRTLAVCSCQTLQCPGLPCSQGNGSPSACACSYVCVCVFVVSISLSLTHTHTHTHTHTQTCDCVQKCNIRRSRWTKQQTRTRWVNCSYSCRRCHRLCYKRWGSHETFQSYLQRQDILKSHVSVHELILGW